MFANTTGYSSESEYQVWLWPNHIRVVWMIYYLSSAVLGQWLGLTKVLVASQNSWSYDMVWRPNWVTWDSLYWGMWVGLSYTVPLSPSPPGDRPQPELLSCVTSLRTTNTGWVAGVPRNIFSLRAMSGSEDWSRQLKSTPPSEGSDIGVKYCGQISIFVRTL